jgi:hypothetical protein
MASHHAKGRFALEGLVDVGNGNENLLSLKFDNWRWGLAFRTWKNVHSPYYIGCGWVPYFSRSLREVGLLA